MTIDHYNNPNYDKTSPEQVLEKIWNVEGQDRRMAVGDFIKILAREPRQIDDGAIKTVAIAIAEEMEEYEMAKWSVYKMDLIHTLGQVGRIKKPVSTAEDKLVWLQLTGQESIESRRATHLTNIIAGEKTPVKNVLKASQTLATLLNDNYGTVYGDRFKIIPEAVLERAYEVTLLTFTKRALDQSAATNIQDKIGALYFWDNTGPSPATPAITPVTTSNVASNVECAGIPSHIDRPSTGHPSRLGYQ